MKIGICAIMAAWDLPYVKEWVEYHAYNGITDILLFLNNWKEEEVEELEKLLVPLAPKCQVRVVKNFDGKAMQVAAYNQGMAIMTALGIDWVAYIDIDEFIKVRSTRKLKDILSDFSQYPQLALNWRLYGSNWIEKVEETYDPDPLDITDRYSVLGRFTKCDSTLNIHVKQMINVSWFRDQHLNLPVFLTPHSTSSISFGLLSEPVVGPFNGLEPGTVREIDLAHYFCKSRQEYLERRKTNRRADSGQVRGEEELQKLWNEMDKNEIDESTLEYQGA